ncbi:unnamed protein product [Prorocentrum cordatum]|uniref:Uncharacterized protein n=1 Tax=Prorocentrum cordatum TaxID=2364126 RepID=A0ABN9U2S9_9DINO|nr:unnamed protein product [Polarella glacialis]
MNSTIAMFKGRLKASTSSPASGQTECSDSAVHDSVSIDGDAFHAGVFQQQLDELIANVDLTVKAAMAWVLRLLPGMVKNMVNILPEVAKVLVHNACSRPGAVQLWRHCPSPVACRGG